MIRGSKNPGHWISKCVYKGETFDLISWEDEKVDIDEVKRTVNNYLLNNYYTFAIRTTIPSNILAAVFPNFWLHISYNWVIFEKIKS